MVNEELLQILRCPACVSGSTRKEGDDPGRLELVREYWLVCQEPDCGRKYPIISDTHDSTTSPRPSTCSSRWQMAR